MNKRKIAILGATGSIGMQALQVVRDNPKRFEVTSLTANSRVEELILLAREFRPKRVVIANRSLYETLKEGLQGLPIEPMAGEEALIEVMTIPEDSLVLSALVGFAGLRPTLAAIDAGKNIALANKEVLVAAGSYVMQAAFRKKVSVFPVDSEHSAIYQCLMGESSPPEELWLTASGGPFLHFPENRLHTVTPKEALKHPRWKMGSKVTIDSATLANKGFEVIEARWLFNLPGSQIKVVIHPESIVHSMVLFKDGAVKAQLAPPDMKLPIALALGEGKRIPNDYSRLNIFETSLHFEAPDMSRFPMLRFAYETLQQGGNAAAILNAADSVAVEAFLAGKIPFTEIPHVAEEMLSRDYFQQGNDIETILATHERVSFEAQVFVDSL